MQNIYKHLKSSEITDDLILDYFCSEKTGKIRNIPARIHELLIKNPEFQNFLDYLEKKFDDSDSIQETIFRIKSQINTRPTCKYCGGHVKFKILVNLFSAYCPMCQKIKNKDLKLKNHPEITDEYILEKYKVNGPKNESLSEYQYLLYRFEDSESVNESLWRLKHKVYKRPVCEYCGQTIKVFRKGFTRYCCHECSALASKKPIKKLEVTDEYIINNVSRIYGENSKRPYKTRQEILDYLKNRYDDSESYQETIYRIKHHIEKRPICPTCGKPIPFNGSFFNKTCGHKCQNTNPEFIRNRQKNYGKKVNLEVEEEWYKDIINDKICIKELIEIKNGKPYINTKKTFWSYLKKHPIIHNYLLNRFSDLYNDTDTKIQEILYRIYYKIEKRPKCPKCGTLYRYLGFQDGYVLKCPYYCLPKEIFQKYNISIICSGGSKEETYLIYKILKFIKPDIAKVHFKSKDYPWYCDLYFEKDGKKYFIEYQGYYSHGPYPFDKNNKDDLELLNRYSGTKLKLLEKGWTVLDPMKRNWAKFHNLNYLEIFPDPEFSNIQVADRITKGFIKNSIEPNLEGYHWIYI